MKNKRHQRKGKDISDLVFDCVVLVRLHGLRGVLLLRIGGLTLSHQGSRFALLICRSGGGDGLIDFHLSVIFASLTSSFRFLLGSRRRDFGLVPSRVWFLARFFLLDALT